MEQLLENARLFSEGTLDGVQDWVIISMMVVLGLIVLASIVALVTSICLSISYMKYNRKKNSLHQSGEKIARRILDKHELQHIKVSSSGSMLFGNSYSHFFKKVRLRRLTWKKESISSLAMATQKSSLAILDKEGDKDMKARVKMTPFIYFGPLAFIPLVIIGILIDLFVIKSDSGMCTIALTAIGLLFYVLSFVMSIMVLKTEKKAQKMALEVMKRDLLATDEEINMCERLYRLYNIEYINNMIIALLEMIYRVLQIIAYVQGSQSSSSK